MSLQLISIHKQYQDKPVLRGIDLSIDKGTFLALLGPSGCGKTTLLQSIAGLTEINSGKIIVDDFVFAEPGLHLPIEKRHVGMVFQDFALWPHMTVFENVAFGLKLKGLRSSALKRRVQETLAIFHMVEYAAHFPHELSGGQKQRIAMARAIAPNPRLILMDEPLSALDTALREEMRFELVRIFKQLEMTVIYVTHDQGEAMSMADKIAILKNGRCEQIGEPEALYKEPISEYVAKIMGPANILKQQGISDIRFIRPDDVEIANGRPGGLRGKISMRSYIGKYYRYIVQVEPYAEPLEVADPRKFEIGENISLVIPDEKCRLLQTV